MLNFKLIAIRLGEGLKYETTINEVNRIAHGIFDFKGKDHPVESITSSRSQLIYNWVMTLADQPIEEESKKKLLEEFIDNLVSLDSQLRRELAQLLDDKLFPAFWSQIHPLIAEVARDKFEHGYYADAVETALKEVNRRVKRYYRKKNGRELDGASLMRSALSPKKPTIVLGDLATETGRNIQQGYMEIFAGSMIGIRNPKAHDNIVIDRNHAIHLVFLASLLMHKLDEAGVIREG